MARPRLKSNNAGKLMDAAERHIRQSGYNAFSFRELAKEVGIKSSSVHYYFPTKADLAAAVARRYTDRFVAALQEKSPSVRIQACKTAFREAYLTDGQMCLCGVLASESAALPEVVALEVRRFFDLCLGLLSERKEGAVTRKEAFGIMAKLEGALLLARVYGAVRAFDEATRSLQ